MSTFFATLRQDLIATRWVLLGWFSLPFVLVRLPPNPVNEPITRIYLTAFLSLSWIVLGLVLFARIAFNHAPSDDRNGWRSRPLNGWVVGLEKLCFAALVFGAPMLAAPDRSEVTSQLLLACRFLLLALFIASLVKKTKAFVAVICTLAALVTVVGYFTEMLGMMFHFNPTGAVLARLVFELGFSSLVILQYARPNVPLHAMAGTGIFLIIAAVSWIFPHSGRPIPMIDEPFPAVQLVEVAPLTDADLVGADDFVAMERFLPEHQVMAWKRYNWEARFNVTGLGDHDVWFVNTFHSSANNRDSLIALRDYNLPCYFPTENLARRIGLGAYRFVDDPGVTFERRFQWTFRHDVDVEPLAPVSTDFRLIFHRVNPAIWVQAALVVGEHGRPEKHGKRRLEITAIDIENGGFEGRLNLAEFWQNRGPVNRNNRNMPYAIVAWNPDTKEAGFVRQRSRPWLPRDAQPDDTPDRFELPHLSGDPTRWRITIFHGITDGRAEIKPADILPPSPSAP